jgi:ferredoxin
MPASMTKSNTPKSAAARRQFIFDTARMVCGVGMLGLGLGLYAKQVKALPALALRPPGALAEDDFLGACIRCGLCVRDCPYDTLALYKQARPGARDTVLHRAQRAVRDVRGHPLRQGVPDCGARSWTDRHQQGENGHRRADRP